MLDLPVPVWMFLFRTNLEPLLTIIDRPVMLGNNNNNVACRVTFCAVCSSQDGFAAQN